MVDCTQKIYNKELVDLYCNKANTNELVVQTNAANHYILPPTTNESSLLNTYICLFTDI